MTPLTDQEQSELRVAEESIGAGLDVQVSFAQLLNFWSSLVEEVGTGYADTVDDYTNELTARDLLERVLQGVSVELAAKLSTLVKPFDDRFASMTTEDRDHRLGRYFTVGSGWWWSRVPKVLTGSLREALQSPAR
jgi:hypothetical protein